MLNPVIGFFKGDDITSKAIMEETAEITETTGDSLNNLLDKILGDLVHSIHPNFLSLSSIFDDEEGNAEETMNNFLSLLFDRKCIHLKIRTMVIMTTLSLRDQL